MELIEGRTSWLGGRGRPLPPYDPDDPGPHVAPGTRWRGVVVLAAVAAALVVGVVALSTRDAGAIGLPTLTCSALISAAGEGDMDGCLTEAETMTDRELTELAEILLGG